MKNNYKLGDKVKIINPDSKSGNTFFIGKKGYISNFFNNGDNFDLTIKTPAYDINCRFNEIELIKKNKENHVMNEKEIYQNAIKTFGAEHQIEKFIEEIGEVLQSLIKWKHNSGRENKVHLIEEMADLEITFNQVKIIIGNPGLFDICKNSKLTRLVELTKEEKEKHVKISKPLRPQIKTC